MKPISVKETRKLLFTPIVENNPIALRNLLSFGSDCQNGRHPYYVCSFNIGNNTF